jgi:hypothetical protein
MAWPLLKQAGRGARFSRGLHGGVRFGHRARGCDRDPAPKIKSASAAKPNASENGLRFHVANAAGFGKALAKEAEVSPHPAEMEAGASDATANLVRMPRPDREAARAKPKTARRKRNSAPCTLWYSPK